MRGNISLLYFLKVFKMAWLYSLANLLLLLWAICLWVNLFSHHTNGECDWSDWLLANKHKLPLGYLEFKGGGWLSVLCCFCFDFCFC